jgi:FSR family fosmidomycin resistance protein-like MFS transporter
MTLLLFLFHFFVDWASSFPTPLGPYIVEHYGLSAKTVAVTIIFLGFFGSLIQPLFALFAPRLKNPFWGLYLALSCVALALFGLSFSFSFAFLFVAFLLLFLANAFFHPLGAALSGSRGEARGVALFTAGGIAGGAVGPLFVTWFVTHFPLSRLMFITLVVWLVLSLYFFRRSNDEAPTFPRGTFSLRLFLPLFAVWFLVGIRTFFTSLFHTFLPLYVTSFSPLFVGGMLLSLGVLVGFFANFLGAHLAERMPNRLLNFLSFIGLGVGLFFLPTTKYLLLITFFALFADFSAFLTMSANVHEAQKILPEHRVFASSVAMGLAWAFGNLLSLLFSGLFGDDVIFVLRTGGIIGMGFAGLLLVPSWKPKKGG